MRAAVAASGLNVGLAEEPVHVVYGDGVNLVAARGEELLDRGLRLRARPSVQVRVAEVAQALAPLRGELRGGLLAAEDVPFEGLDRDLVEARVVRRLVAEFVARV